MITCILINCATSITYIYNSISLFQFTLAFSINDADRWSLALVHWSLIYFVDGLFSYAPLVYLTRIIIALQPAYCVYVHIFEIGADVWLIGYL